MAYEFDDYRQYVNGIVQGEGVQLSSPLKVNDQSQSIGFRYSKKENIVLFGQNSLTCILLYASYRVSPKKIRKLLFLYYLAYQNLSSCRLNSSMYLFQKVCNEMDKKWKQIYGIANGIFIDEIVAFLIGHETAHACFKADTEYKKRITCKIKENFPTTGEAESLRQKYAFSLIPDSITDAELEEFSCDYISLKWFFKHYVKYEKYSIEDIKKIITQLLNIVMMQMYPSNFSTMQSFNLLKGGFSLHAHKHIACVFRLGLATAAIIDIIDDKYDFDFKSFFEEQMKLSKKIMDGIWRLDFSNQLTLMSLVRSNETSNMVDIEHVNEFNKIFSNISEEIQKILLGKIEE